MHPERFGKFRILKKLPGGGMGRVYHAIDTSMNRPVALKLIDHGTDQESIDVVDAERRGAILQLRLCELDTRVTQIYEYGDLDGHFYIAMEYIEGQDLSELLHRQGIGIPFAVRIARDICDVLDHAHNFRSFIEGQEYSGVVHGDVKPRNIRITSTGQVKLLDFGIAKALSMTRRFTHNQFGSVQYSSPERLNSGEVDAHSDLWSVAVVLYEMVAREPYFRAESVPKLEYAIRNYRDLKPLPEEWPEELRALLARGLAPELESRFKSAAEMRAALEEFSGDAYARDSESTRRTHPGLRSASGEETGRSGVAVAEPAEETRRTTAAGPRLTSSPVRVRKPVDPRVRMAKTFLGGFVMMFTLYLFWNEWNVWRDSTAFAHALDSERLRDTNAAWEQYNELAGRGHLPAVMSTARDAMRRKLLRDATRVIEAYRKSDNAPISEADWQRCESAARRALELITGDKTIRGTLRVCDGHLARIRGTYRANAEIMDSAREKFEEAAALLPKSPDPYLGLARLYVYGFKDVAKAEKSLEEAQERGHRSGRREIAHLADGYIAAGDRLVRESEKVFDLPEEEEYLKRAADHYDRARELYESVAPFGNSTASLRKLHDARAAIQLRREERRRYN